jgi:S1-C subfamily serine protease
MLLFGLAQGQTSDVDLEALKRRLTGAQISKGPDAAGVTRSPWGPEMYRATVDSVVLVAVKDKGFGSGVVISPNCHLLTNWHVVGAARQVAVIFRPLPPRSLDTVTKDDLRRARVLKIDQPTDLALLQIDPCPSGVRHLPLEEPDRIEVGQDVFAIGHPEQLYWTYTEGVISQIRPRNRWQAESVQFVATVLQTQTPISFGSSGGPLINRSGRIVGIISNTLVDRAGFNFAIAVHDVRPFLTR